MGYKWDWSMEENFGAVPCLDSPAWPGWQGVPQGLGP